MFVGGLAGFVLDNTIPGKIINTVVVLLKGCAGIHKKVPYSISNSHSVLSTQYKLKFSTFRLMVG